MVRAMSNHSAQPALFDLDQVSDVSQAASARERMQGMIARLAGAEVPPWKDQMGVILDDGAFQRAMRLVPDAEAQALWLQFDAQMERLYAVWAEGELPAGG